MGCGFDLAIEALFDGRWVAVVKMFDKTCTGGYPLADAMWSLLKYEGIRGTYGIEYPDGYIPSVLWREKSTTPNDGISAAAKDSADSSVHNQNEVQAGQEGNVEQNDSDEDDQWETAYYSCDHVRLLANYCGPTLSKTDLMSRTFAQKDYLRQLPAWMQLARYAYPYRAPGGGYSGGAVYDFYDNTGSGSNENLSTIPNILKKQREIRQGKLNRVVTIALGPRLKADICQRIALYALPLATDVRLAMKVMRTTCAEEQLRLKALASSLLPV
jgi:hypothetical protein